MARVLIVDDDTAYRDSLAETLHDLGHEVAAAASGEEGLVVVNAGPGLDLVLLDLRMPGRLDGMGLLRILRQRHPLLPVAILTAFASAGNTIEAMRLGAYDHLAKPVGRDDIARLLRSLPQPHDLAGAGPDGVVPSGGPVPPGGLVGSSDAMRTVQKTIGLVADSDATVLITGETGTGKEVVARAIHQHGRRAGKPFVAVNCAAIPKDLLESELFGHAKGAFTGAVAARLGAFREAAGGTLFLDEIGDMDLAMQAKILRALQERTVTPVGGRPEAVDIRVIAATHRDLRAAIADGTFRLDLFYRLNVVPIAIAPLRERLADIVPLAEHFLQASARDGAAKRLTADAAARLVAHGWRGNVRELRNVMERASVLARGPVLRAEDLGALGTDLADAVPAGAPDDAGSPAEDLAGAVARLEAQMIAGALRRAGGNRAEAARSLGIHRQLLYAKIEKYGLDVSGSRTPDVREDDAPPPRPRHGSEISQ